MNSCRRLTVFALLAAAAVWGQVSTSKSITVRGEIVSSAPLIGSWTVELGGNGAGISQSAAVNADNTFEFPSATPGTYQLRVIAPSGKLCYEDYVTVNPNQTLSIRLADDRPQANRSTGNTISLEQLSHKVPARAQKAFQKGEQAATKGNIDEARNCFRLAVTLDPEFVDAYNELGATEAQLNNLPEAATQFQKAIDLVPEHRQALPNLSIVLAKMRRFHEAGEVARRALKVVPESGRIHYILAVSLLADGGDFEEIILQFERATSEIPSAHVTVAELLAQHGRPQEAIHHLEAYLQVAEPDDALRAKAEARLTQLRQ